MIIDTAGRLHTQHNLMDELAKMRRVMQKIVPGAPDQTLLVLDGNTGQNALVQAEVFTQKIDVSGLIVTKLDGSAKGGFVFALSKHLQKPLYFVGMGEQPSDFRPFSPEAFAEAVLGE